MNTRVPKKPPRHCTEGFSDRLVQARGDAGLTQDELAAQTNLLVSVRTLSDWENGVSYPNLGPHIRAVARELDVSLAWLLRGDESGSRAGSRSHDSGG